MVAGPNKKCKIISLIKLKNESEKKIGLVFLFNKMLFENQSTPFTGPAVKYPASFMHKAKIVKQLII
jgi:hypothetical protein